LREEAVHGTYRPPPVLQHSDLIIEELAMLQAPESERYVEYWAAHYDALDDAIIGASELPFVSPTRGLPTSDILSVALSEDEARQVRQACGGRPDYAFWRTMYGIALGMLVNRTRVAFTANFLNRRRADALQAIAWCAHPHLLTVDAPWSLRWTDVWRQVRTGVRQAQAHERYSWDALAQRLGRRIGTGSTYLTFDVLPGYSTYNDAPLQPVVVPGALPGTDLSVRIRHTNRHYTLMAVFNSGRYESEGVRHLLALLHDTIGACAAQPEATVGDVVRAVRERQRRAVCRGEAVDGSD
jgi:hypothetical protein